jgi:DNA-directed RNA polymerase subunit RPC12/RpoP
MGQDDIIVLRKFDSPIEANIARAKLDAYGIPCFLTEEHLTQLINSVLSGGIRLHVFASDKETANEVLEKDYLSKSDDEQMLECPVCRSKKILGNSADGIHKQMSKAITDAFLGISKPYYCLDCGKEFDI